MTDREIAIPSDVLADRYASPEMLAIWSPTQKIIEERKLWIAALKAKRDLGYPVPDGTIEAYERVVHIVDFESIKRRELRLKQDVKARIEEFNELAGGIQYIHLGFTSRDLTDNVEQMQIKRAFVLVRNRTVALFSRLGDKGMQNHTLQICGRSHLVPAQTVTLGKRFATHIEELHLAFMALERFIVGYPLRGIKGAVGTQQDMIDLLGSPEKAAEFEAKMAAHLGFTTVFNSTGQVYPRSLDFQAVSLLFQLAAAPANFAVNLRLMAGLELAHEGEKEGGSSAMPHKVNSRTCERICGLRGIIAGFLRMIEEPTGTQWFEGDVSCSVIRRVVFPGAFYAIDGLLEATMTVLDEMEIFPGMIKHELDTYLPFLSTTALLMAVVKKGQGREDAHKLIRRYALTAVDALRWGRPHAFVKNLGEDDRFPLNEGEILEIISKPNHGDSEGQMDRGYQKVIEIIRAHPGTHQYTPSPLR